MISNYQCSLKCLEPWHEWHVCLYRIQSLTVKLTCWKEFKPFIQNNGEEFMMNIIFIGLSLLFIVTEWDVLSNCSPGYLPTSATQAHQNYIIFHPSSPLLYDAVRGHVEVDSTHTHGGCQDFLFMRMKNHKKLLFV